MLLLPSERDLPRATIGLRLFSRDAAMRAGKPYAIISGAGEGPPMLPWWAWLTIGGAVVGLGYLAFTRRDGRDVPTYILVDRDAAPPPEAVAAAAAVAVEPSPVHVFSSDVEHVAAFDRDVDSIGRGISPWEER